MRHVVHRNRGYMLEVEKDHEAVLARHLATSCYIPRVLRPTISLATSFGAADSLNVLPRTIEATKKMYADGDFAQRYLHTIGPEQNWTWTNERRAFWSENIVMFRVDEKEGKAGALKQSGAYIESLLVQEHLIEKYKCGTSCFLIGPGADLSGPRWGPNSNVYADLTSRSSQSLSRPA